MLRLMHGDITEEAVDVIVNAANSQLAHAGGLAAAIVRKGGQQIQAESLDWVKRHGPVSHDQPALTGAGELPCQYILHAVGPVWGSGEEDQKLRNAVRGCLRLAQQKSFTSIAFPAISTGIFGFPKARAAQIMLHTIQEFVEEGSGLQDIRITLFDKPSLDAFVDAFHARWTHSDE
jgi:putative ATPase